MKQRLKSILAMLTLLVAIIIGSMYGTRASVIAGMICLLISGLILSIPDMITTYKKIFR